jgi:hypothetical protein
MLNFNQVRTTAFSIVVVSMLSACGGGDSSHATPSASVMNDFSTAYASGVAKLTSYAGLTSTSFADTFDSAYLDSGLSKADVMAALQSEAQATATSPDFPSFAQVTLSDLNISNCDGSTQVCTLTGTLSNSGVETTSVPFTTQVKLSDKARLYGDQSKS